jgi:hypothetical protein
MPEGIIDECTHHADDKVDIFQNVELSSGHLQEIRVVIEDITSGTLVGRESIGYEEDESGVW